MTHSSPPLGTSAAARSPLPGSFENTDFKPICFVRKSALLQELEVSKSTLEAWISDGLFPRPTSLGPRAVAWPRQQIEDWKHARIAASRDGRTQ
jgi:prophage regulatory protein